MNEAPRFNYQEQIAIKMLKEMKRDPEKARYILSVLLKDTSRDMAVKALQDMGAQLKQQHEVSKALIACAKSFLDSETKE